MGPCTLRSSSKWPRGWAYRWSISGCGSMQGISVPQEIHKSHKYCQRTLGLPVGGLGVLQVIWGLIFCDDGPCCYWNRRRPHPRSLGCAGSLACRLATQLAAGQLGLLTGVVSGQPHWMPVKGAGLIGMFSGEVVELLCHLARIRAIRTSLAAARVRPRGDLVGWEGSSAG